MLFLENFDFSKTFLLSLGGIERGILEIIAYLPELEVSLLLDLLLNTFELCCNILSEGFSEQLICPILICRWMK